MNTIRFLTAILFSIVLAACSGGGGGSGTNSTVTPTTYTISGTVTSGGTALANVAIALTGTANASTTTDASGNYSFTTLANGSYSVAPTLSGYTFNPSSLAVTVSGANSTAHNFAATAVVAGTSTYGISGTVSGAATSGVTVVLSGAGNASTTTGSNGAYSFTGLVAGSYTVAPSLTGYTFNPGSNTAVISTANITGKNFTASVVGGTTYSISGTVSGAVSSGVLVTLSGAANQTATTASNGSYSFTGLVNGSYNVTASLTGFTFSPNGAPVTLNGANVTATNFASTATVASLYSVSGAVTGSFVQGLTINLSGNGQTGSATTNASGNYSFSSLPAGTYTFTASPLSGYTYTTAATATVTTANATASNIVATSAIPSYSISGTVSYAGTKTGNVTVYVAQSGSPNFKQWSTQVALVSGSGTYKIRGIQYAGNYLVTAQMDTLNNGSGNASNPVSATLTSTMSGAANLGGQNLTLVDPTAPAPVTPVISGVYPSAGAVFVTHTFPKDVSGQEVATAYKVYWGTDVAASNGSSQTDVTTGPQNGSPIVVPSLTNGTAYYFKISALVGTVESATSAVTGPITIGNVTGGNTVTGTVSSPGAVIPTTGAFLLVGTYSATGAGVYFTLIPNPTNAQAYTVTGVPTGTYYNFAVLSLGNGTQLSNTNGNAPMIPVNVATTSNLTLSSTNSTLGVTTDYSAQYSSNSLVVRPVDGSKRVVGVTMLAGLNVAVPMDLAATANNQGWVNLANVPTVGDSYSFRVHYSDGTNEILSGSVSGVLGSGNEATGLATSAVAAGATVGAPQFSWLAPATPPTGTYTYTVGLSGPTNGWYSNSILSTTLNVLYNFDGNSITPSLTANGLNSWNVQVQDAFGNSATSLSATY